MSPGRGKNRKDPCMRKWLLVLNAEQREEGISLGLTDGGLVGLVNNGWFRWWSCKPTTGLDHHYYPAQLGGFGKRWVRIQTGGGGIAPGWQAWRR